MLWLAAFASDTGIALGEDAVELRPGLWLIRSERTRSRLYHAIKRQLPDGTPLLVAELAGDPKFKGMAPGALAWLRHGPGP